MLRLLRPHRFLQPLKLQQFLCIACPALLFLTTPACKLKDSLLAQPQQKQAAESTKAEILWDWSRFPKATEITLGTMPVEIQPKQSIEVKAESTGTITLEINKRVSTIEKDTVIGRMDVDTISEEEERLAISEEKQVLEEIKTKKIDLPLRRKQAQEELQKARKKVRLTELLLRSPALQDMSDELGLGSDLDNVTEETLRKAKAELELAEKNVTLAEKIEEKLRIGSQRLQEIDLERNKRQHLEAKEKSVYRAPISGELRLEVDFVEDQTNYSIGARETIATINDYDEIHAQLKVTNADWVNLQPQRLYLQLHDSAKTSFSFQDDRIEKDTRTLREERQYIFSIPLEQNTELKRLTGTNMQANLIYKLPATCYLVPKYNLSLYALGKSNSTEWQEIVKQLWPTAKILGEGRKHLAIQF